MYMHMQLSGALQIGQRSALQEWGVSNSCIQKGNCAQELKVGNKTADRAE